MRVQTQSKASEERSFGEATHWSGQMHGHGPIAVLPTLEPDVSCLLLGFPRKQLLSCSKDLDMHVCAQSTEIVL